MLHRIANRRLKNASSHDVSRPNDVNDDVFFLPSIESSVSSVSLLVSSSASFSDDDDDAKSVDLSIGKNRPSREFDFLFFSGHCLSAQIIAHIEYKLVSGVSALRRLALSSSLSRGLRAQQKRAYASDPNAPPKVAYPWKDPMNPGNWKEEHLVFVISAGGARSSRAGKRRCRERASERREETTIITAGDDGGANSEEEEEEEEEENSIVRVL